MTDLNKLIRQNVLNLTPYSCARDEFSGKEGIFLDANENPFGTLNRYPDPYQRDLKAAVAKLKNIAPERIFLGNGSDEIIDLTYRIFCKPGRDKVLLFTPTYGMYSVSAEINDVDILNIPLDNDFRINPEALKPFFVNTDIKLVFICSPNNPTSNSVTQDEVVYILDNFGGIVVIDEAYIDFSDKQSFIKLTERYDNLVVMQTFSKAWGLAAARVGMAFSNPEILSYYNKMKPPYNISSINQEAVMTALKDSDRFNKIVKLIKEEKKRLSAGLVKLKQVERVYPSDANFLLVKVKDATETYNKLINRNIVVR
ncbi:MAG TPA: histidinol-phosphate transaminase, partial [Bacteroidales bacterium]|nr:histidinol-phosphate transaminase [Bacteroidales bacterium]